MPLSINKLEKLLEKKGLIIDKIYVIDNICIYLELMNTYNADTFLLYIPSKYDIKVEYKPNIYRIEYIDIDEYGNIAEDYAGNPDDFDLEKTYEQVDLNNDIDKTKDLTKTLEENYNHPVSLKNITKRETDQLREIFRQLRRLKLCVQNVKYKLSILSQYFICSIRYDDTFEAYFIKNTNKKPNLKLMVYIDLETMYEKIDSMTIDVHTIRESVYKILDRNQQKHVQNLHKMLEQKNSLTLFSDNILDKKTKYFDYLQKLEELLETLNSSERTNIEKITDINDQYSKELTSIKTIHSDIERTRQIAKHETEISQINKVRQEIIRNIVMIKSTFEDIALKTDNICFDNTIMIDAILKNFITLSKI